MKTPHITEKCQAIKLLISDVDGVLTDGLLYYQEDQIVYKAFHVHDGLGLKLIQLCGIEVGIITTCTSSTIHHRMQQLGIKHVYQGHVNKLKAYQDLLTQTGLADHQVAYIGDDLPDLPLIERVGLGVAVANATPYIKQAADWVTEKNGGCGAVREVCDLLLTVHDPKLNSLQQYHQQYANNS